MANTSRNNTLWYPVIFMTLLSFVMILVLALLDYATKDIIALQQKAMFNQKMLYAINVPFENNEDVEKIFNENIEVKPIDFMDTSNLSLEENYYIYKKDGIIKAYVFPITGKGLWGSVEAIIAIDSDMENIIGIDIISHSETPGLGGRIEEQWYKEQFRGIRLVLNEGKFFEFAPSKYGNIDAITGATLTSSSMRDMLNENVLKIKNNFRGGY